MSYEEATKNHDRGSDMSWFDYSIDS